MGVRGFTTFVNAHPELLTAHLLYATRVIVDGNNFVYWLYLHSHIPCKFGANLDEFRNAIWKFVALLRRCEIEPYFVFDGGHQSDAKWRTSLERAKERIQIAEAQLRVMESQGKRKAGTVVECKSMLPILALDAAKQILKVDCGVQCTTCDFEADSKIAQLAHELRVPVLSNDSDFFVYALHFGAIPFWSVNMHAVKLTADSTSEEASAATGETAEAGAERFALKVKIFTLANLRRFARLEKDGHAELIPLVAALMGNDTVQRGVFKAFFASVRLGRAELEAMSSSASRTRKRGKKRPRTAARELSNFDSLFCWLARFNSKQEAMEAILQRVKLQKRATIERLIQSCYAGYQLNDSLEQDASVDVEVLAKLANEPAWFTDAVRRCEISATLANTCRNSRIILQAQVEDTSATSSYACCQSLRDRLYATVKSAAGQKDRLVIEYGRSTKNMAKRLVQLANSDVTFDSLQSAQSVDPEGTDSESEERKRMRATLFYKLCDCNESFREHFETLCKQVPASLHFALFVTAFWSTHSLCVCDANTRQCVLLALLVNFSKLNVADLLQASDTHAIDAVARELVQTVRDRLKTRLAKYTDEEDNVERLKLRRRLDLSVLQMLAEFQSCTLFLHFADQLCDHAMARFHFAKLLNSSLVFHFALYLARRSQPLLLVEQLLGETDQTGLLWKFVELTFRQLSCLLGTENCAAPAQVSQSEFTVEIDNDVQDSSDDSEADCDEQSSEKSAASERSSDEEGEDLCNSLGCLNIDAVQHSENKFAILLRNTKA